MSFAPSDEQRAVIDATAPVVVVLGGAGCGKTTTAAAAVRRRFDLALTHSRERSADRLFATSLEPPKRALMVSFSKTAVTQAHGRAGEILGSRSKMLDVVTFHGLSWRILNNFGRYAGLLRPIRVKSSSEAKILGDSPGFRYDELISAATKILGIPAVRDYYSRRYGTVICDEFQDTSEEEWALVEAIAPTAQRILLGDPNQCIYADMKHINPYERVDQACALPDAMRIELSPLSYRDPSGVLPAAALAAKNRSFEDPAITAAVRSNRIILRRAPANELFDIVENIIRKERAGGKTVNVFTHTNAAATELATHLTYSAIQHEQVGFTESFSDGLQAQFACLKWALTGAPGARVALAVYASSIKRGNERNVSKSLIEKSMPQLEDSLASWTRNLRSAATGPSPDYDKLLNQLAQLHQYLNFPRGLEMWMAANAQLRRAVRVLQDGGTVDELQRDILETQASALVGATPMHEKPVKVMNLHQTKGREADTTILLLEPGEFHGSETEPYPTGSRLLYVCLTRARERAHIVSPDDLGRVHGLWQPFVRACSSEG